MTCDMRHLKVLCVTSISHIAANASSCHFVRTIYISKLPRMTAAVDCGLLAIHQSTIGRSRWCYFGVGRRLCLVQELTISAARCHLATPSGRGGRPALDQRPPQLRHPLCQRSDVTGPRWQPSSGGPSKSDVTGRVTAPLAGGAAAFRATFDRRVAPLMPGSYRQWWRPKHIDFIATVPAARRRVLPECRNIGI